ncbi:zf-CHY-domain-containing protein, partial [Thozetella sp. PMI_491]
MEGYTKSQLTSQAKRALRPESPSSQTLLAERSVLPGALQTLWNSLSDNSGPLDLPLTEEDLRPTYAPPPQDDFVERIDGLGAGQKRLGCEHYQRNVKLQCVVCERWYTCRLCHDDAESHILPRYATRNMLCMLCGCAQRVGDTCVGCGESAAHYYCSICRLWNDNPNKPIYHCNDCGICRIGQGIGKDFFHCSKCAACIPISMEGGQHKCIERAIDSNCPICGEHMFSSRTKVIFMNCGHAIHRPCWDEHMKTSYKCPICNKSCVNMETQFRNLDIMILNQPMPAEYRDTRAIISCNDCSAKSQTAYHWLGLKC